MLLKNRLFERRKPSRDAKSIYFFCEGVKREHKYFLYFKEIDSRINVEIYPLTPEENNSPTGLFKIALDCLVKSEHNPRPRYEFIPDLDEVWFIVDTDEWGQKVQELRELCGQYANWNVGQSNPCFEVWLYYHFHNEFPDFDNMEVSKKWKEFLNSKVKGGFDSAKHPIFLENAIKNSKENFSEEKNQPIIGCTELFLPGESIFPLIHEKLNSALESLNS